MKKLLLFVGVRLVLAAILTTVIVVFKWEYFRTGAFTWRFINTPVYWVIHVMIVLLMISALVKPLRELYKRRSLPLQSSIEHLTLGLKRAFSKLSIQFAFWGLIVFLVVVALWQLGPLRDDGFRFNQVGPWRTATPGESEVRLFYLLTRDNNHDRYLESCLRVTQDLKEVGAKVVFIPLPYFVQSDEAIETIRKINETGIAVFGIVNSWSRDFQKITARARDLRVGLFDPPDNRFSFVQEVTFSPKGFANPPGVTHDAVFEVLGQYYGVPNTELAWNGSEVVVGDNRYATDAYDRVFVGRMGYRGGSWSTIVAGHGIDWFGQKGIRSSDKDKQLWRFEYVDAATLTRKEPEYNLRSHRGLYEGKIVILQWSDLGVAYPPYPPWEGTYAWMIDCLIRGDIPARSGFGTTTGIVISIFITALILYAARPLMAPTLIVLFWGLEFLVPSWFFQVQGILIDAPPIFAASLAAATVFTVIRLGNEWRTRPLVAHMEPAAPVEVAAVAQTSSPGPAFFKKRFAVSYSLATGILALTVALTVVMTTALQTHNSDEEQDVVYVMSYPAIEVQGDNPAEQNRD